MAKVKSRSYSKSKFRYSYVPRDRFTPIASLPRLRNIPIRVAIYDTGEDHRRWSPVSPRPLRTLHGAVAPVKPKNRPGRRYSPVLTYGYTVSKAAVLCARRKIRKEVIFAKGAAGGGNRPPRWNQNSNVICQ